MKWGLAGGTMAGMMLSDLLDGQANSWATELSPNRLTTASLPALARMNLKVGADFVGDRISPGQTGTADQVPRGQARTLRHGHERTGVYRDDDGLLHAVSLRCTHLGCLLRFNGAERSWDCPCHGSRFDTFSKDPPWNRWSRKPRQTAMALPSRRVKPTCPLRTNGGASPLGLITLAPGSPA